MLLLGPVRLWGRATLLQGLGSRGAWSSACLGPCTVCSTAQSQSHPFQEAFPDHLHQTARYHRAHHPMTSRHRALSLSDVPCSRAISPRAHQLRQGQALVGLEGKNEDHRKTGTLSACQRKHLHQVLNAPTSLIGFIRHTGLAPTGGAAL